MSDYKSTLKLPQTGFPMKANLKQKEPETLKFWAEMDAYAAMVAAGEGGETYVLHDGPPYANGHIHMGTAMNKVLKDIVVKSRNMAGLQARYVPGWDCHGLPIEHKVETELKKKKKELPAVVIRKLCREYALKFLDIQRSEFKRLGVLGDWDHPYKTLAPEYEAATARELGRFMEKGSVVRGKKPIYWCCSCHTALAEAEVEYADHSSPSIYVRFPLTDKRVQQLLPAGTKYDPAKTFVVIWTTTPWTLPDNMAVAVHPEFDYVLAEAGGSIYLLAARLLAPCAEIFGWDSPKILATVPGAKLEGLEAQHPFYKRKSPVILGAHVTLDAGTGCVHTAPGHGREDYDVGLKYGLEVYSPLDDAGRFLTDVEFFAGLNVFEANPKVIEKLKQVGNLLAQEKISHSYPHCWRCKEPVIFRATTQWFISMDAGGLRAKAMEAIKTVRWVPAWGEERMSSMMAGRPDWCISRQRSWGVPIPAFVCRACGRVVASEAIALRVADIYQAGGSNAWFEKTAAELLPPGTVCPDCGSPDLEKENNILDVWFESGASHNVLGKRPELPWPADVYIEGHDQHRGWFNSSLVIGVGAKGGSPYRSCITCGFVLDDKGRAMSKSAGNVIEPETVIARGGAEILRLWVAMLNYKEDAPYGAEIEQRIVEAYRKIRNTWRFLLGNLYDFEPDRDGLPASDLEPLDRWALRRFGEVGRRMRQGYEDYEYHVVYHALSQFFTVDLSAFYLDVLKDRLYCSGRTSRLRRSAQTALFLILRDSLTLMAPILPFTAEEAWDAVPAFAGREDSVHLRLFPDLGREWMPDAEAAEWEELLTVRQAALKELELARERKEIGNALEARVRLTVPAAQAGLLERHKDGLAALLIVSEVVIEDGPALAVKIEPAAGSKCARCWTYSTEVGQSAEHPDFCRRCDDVVSGRA